MPAVIFNGAKTKNLKDELQLLTGSSIISRAVDPTSVAQAGEPGSLLSNPSTGNLYKKLDSGTTTNWELITSAVTADQSYELSNLGIDATVASNNLTIAIKTKSGSNATSNSPVRVGFRNATIATGQYSTVIITGALSTVINSGSTLNIPPSTDTYIYIYLINNAGTAEIAYSRSIFDESTVHSTTAEGGGSAGDSSDLYSTTARSNVAIRLVGKLLINLTTPGTWDSAPSLIAIQPIETEKPMARAGASNNSISTGGTIAFNNEFYDTRNSFDISSGTYTVKEEGNYRVVCAYETSAAFAGVVSQNSVMYLDKNSGSELINMDTYYYQTTASIVNLLYGSAVTSCSVGDTLEVKINHPFGSPFTGNNSNQSEWIYIEKII